MSEQGKGSLLLPFGIGAGLLLLYFNMKKKEPPVTPATTEPAALLPEVKEGEAAVPQIEPTPAPSYTQVARTTQAQDDDTDEPDDAASDEDQETDDPAGQQTPATNQEQDDEGDSEQSSSSSGEFTASQRSSIPSASRQVIPTPAAAYVQPAINVAVASGKVTGRLLANKVAQPMMRMVNRKALLAKKGKYRVKAQPVIPPAIAPAVVAQSAQVPFVSITSNSTPASAKPVAQATIFPLRFGTTSPYVKEVQRRIGVPATGYFGAMTRTAIQKRFRVNEISEVLYKQIITGKRAMPLTHKPVAKAVYKTKKPLHARGVKAKHR